MKERKKELKERYIQSKDQKNLKTYLKDILGIMIQLNMKQPIQQIQKKIYRFYSNGAYKSPYDNKVYLTKDLINGKLNNNKPDQKIQVSSHKEIAKEYHSTIITQAKEIFKEFSLTLNRQEHLNTYTYYKNNKLDFDISKYCDSRGNLTQKEQLKTDIKNQKDQIDKKEKNKAELKKAETFLKGKTYKVNRLFKDNPKVS